MTATDKTKYHVFTEAEAAGVKTYVPHAANVEANSTEHAIRQTAKTTGVYVAVPARSFTPTKVTIETHTTVKVGAA